MGDHNAELARRGVGTNIEPKKDSIDLETARRILEVVWKTHESTITPDSED